MNEHAKHLTDEEAIEFLEDHQSDRLIKAHLATCDQCSQLVKQYEHLLGSIEHSPRENPPVAIATGFAAALAEERGRLVSKRSFPYWQVAAAVALVLIGFFSGRFSAPDQSHQVLALQAQVDLLKEMTMVNALKKPSASERLQTVNMIEEERTPKAGKQLIEALLNTLNNDESPNVRYAAAMALGRFLDQEEVRLALAKSLSQQQDALIQIALISMLLEAQEKTAIKPLKEIIESEKSLIEVRKQARVALEILS